MEMRNAKQEMETFFARRLNPKRTLVCAEVTHAKDAYEDDGCDYNLAADYSEEEYARWLQSLDFEYNAGFGGQELFGTLWFSDDTWAYRGEYDGSEWWMFCERPEIPQDLQSPRMRYKNIIDVMLSEQGINHIESMQLQANEMLRRVFPEGTMDEMRQTQQEFNESLKKLYRKPEEE